MPATPSAIDPNPTLKPPESLKLAGDSAAILPGTAVS